jgi:hypothetical protein
MTINSVAVEGVSLVVNLGIELDMVEHTEGLVSRVKTRKPTGIARFFRPLQASLNVHSLWNAGTIVPITFQVDNGSKLVLVTCKAQLEEPRESEHEGLFCYEQPFRCIASSSGNDEVTVAFGDV